MFIPGFARSFAAGVVTLAEGTSHSLEFWLHAVHVLACQTEEGSIEQPSSPNWTHKKQPSQF